MTEPFAIRREEPSTICLDCVYCYRKTDGWIACGIIDKHRINREDMTRVQREMVDDCDSWRERNTERGDNFPPYEPYEPCPMFYDFRKLPTHQHWMH